MEIEITWKVSDGYINNGPQYTIIDADDFDVDQDIEDIIAEIERTLEQDFTQSISFDYKQEHVEEAAAKIKAYLEKRADEEEE